MTMTRLEQEPDARSHTLAELMGLAAAMESEAILRYGQLAAEMSRRGDHGLAAMFQVLLEEERAHLAGIERWSRATTGDSPPAARRPWQLPPEIARSWEEAVRSALLTPYRALSIAVLNEDRGFAFYTYVAARAEDTAARAAAERLAAEELNHAALLRRERRRAWRSEQRGQTPAERPITPDATDFARRAWRIETDAAQRHARLAERLAALEHGEDASALHAIAEEERQAARIAGSGAAGHASVAAAEEPAPEANRAALLRASLAESERLYDIYADLANQAGTETVLLAAQDGARRAVRHIATLVVRLHASGS
jgi:rubrerythrin